MSNKAAVLCRNDQTCSPPFYVRMHIIDAVVCQGTIADESHMFMAHCKGDCRPSIPNKEDEGRCRPTWSTRKMEIKTTAKLAAAESCMSNATDLVAAAL